MASLRSTLVTIDVATGKRRTLLGEEDYEYASPAISPDGDHVAAVREARSTPTDPPDLRLVVVSLADGAAREVATGWDRWPSVPRWTPDGAALIVTADNNGRSPIFRIDLESGDVVQLTADDAAYTDVVVSPDGATIYALRTSHLAPAAPVRLDATVADQVPRPLPAPAPAPELPGGLTELSTITRTA